MTLAYARSSHVTSVEDAQRAIKAMPEGYKLARISFAIELSDELRAADDQAFRDAGADSTANCR